ncbi:MAG TPA: hypothetical protein PLR18_03625 [bacterium]|nr:hypothetical protein [bacterium]
MKKIFILFVIIIALGPCGCAKNKIDSNPTPNNSPLPQALEEETGDEQAEIVEPAGFSGIKSMNVCRGNSNLCYTRDVEFIDGEVESIIMPEGKIIEIEFSDCQEGYCYAEDTAEGEWDLVESEKKD